MRRRPWLALLAGMLAGAGCMTRQDELAPLHVFDTGEAPVASGTGALCAFGIAAAQAEFGRRCRPGRNPAVQAELEQIVSRLEAYIATDPRFGPAQIEAFKREQAWVGEERERLCGYEGFQNYDRYTPDDVRSFRAQADAIIARGGPVEWGDCL